MSNLRRQLELLHRTGATRSDPDEGGSPPGPWSRRASSGTRPPGEERENRLGRFLCRRWECPRDEAYGPWPLDSLHSFCPRWLERLGLEGFDPSRAVFLDTETTGLAGGTGTYAFLVGVAWLEPERVVLEQLMMREHCEEAALLEHLGERLKDCQGVVTYNGKSFDLQLLQTRFLMKRQRCDLESLPHFDLLHPSRRIWGNSFPDCRLETLEQQVLGLPRSGDVPGWLIPRLYFQFLRSRDFRPLLRVLEHNRRDLLSLMGLVGALRHHLEQPAAPRAPLQDFSLGRWFEELGLPDLGWRLMERALETSLPSQYRRAAQLRLARLRRRQGDREGAANLWSEVLGENPYDPEAGEELAKHLEHHCRDYPAALKLVEGVLRQRGLSPTLQRRLQERRERLLKRMAG